MLVKLLYGNNIKGNDNRIIYIPTGSTFEQVKQTLQDSNVVVYPKILAMTAEYMKYPSNIKAGRYLLKPGMNSKEIIAKLRIGEQDPLKVTIHSVRTLNNLAGKAAGYFEQDSLAFLTNLLDPSIYEEYNFSRENFLSMFIPNTYEMLWTTTPEAFISRMKREYDKYWNETRLTKIEQNQLTPTDAYTIASIVEKETNYDPERPAVAGVYINRLKTGQKLQADPTVVFALGDFNLQRVLFKHLDVDSPYNTYRYSGLPPGPICMPSMSSLEAVVNAENHNYMFFCAKPDNSGTHAFAVTYAEHLKNAAAFSSWLNSRNIK